MIEVNATVHKVSTDRDGEVTATFKIPMVDRTKAIALSVLTKKPLKLRIINPATEKGSEGEHDNIGTKNEQSP